MSNELKEKIQYLKSKYYQMKGNDSFSFHRFAVFVTSAKGRRRIVNFTGRSVKYVFRKIFGIKKVIVPEYELWLKKYTPDQDKINQYSSEAASFKYRPLISVLLPCYNAPAGFLNEAIESVISQVYDNWELCISDDNSSNPEVRQVLEKYSVPEYRDKIKIVYRNVNGHISENSNSAFGLSTGEYIALLDHDDLLTPDALFQNVKLINDHPDADLIYSDEDKLDEEHGLTEPYFKPDWCPESLLSRNYIGHLVVLRRSLFEKAGKFRTGFEGSQDYDLLLRVTELTRNIFHLPMVLYHWRKHSESTSDSLMAKPYAIAQGIRALEEALIRRKREGTVNAIENLPGYYSVRFKIVNTGKVSIIIPTKNKQELCDVLLSSIFERTDYPDFEVILVDNNSDEPEFFEMRDKWKLKEPERFFCHRIEEPFNFSRLMNFGTGFATGKYYLLLNNDTEIIHADWMSAMVEYCQFDEIGAVGAKLLFENDTIQHAGVIIGLGGIAGHTFVALGKDDPGYYFHLQAINNYSAVTAACVMVKKKHYDEVNGFNEELAVEFNDVDFCLKLIEKGYRNIYLPHVTLYHYESISRGHPHKDKKSYQQHLKDVAYFKSKWQHFIDHDPCYNIHLSLIFTDFRLRLADQGRYV